MRLGFDVPSGVLGLWLLVAVTSPALAQQTVTYPAVGEPQIPGGIAVIAQTGGGNAASVEQQAILGAGFANSAQIQQNGTGNTASVIQQGQQNSAAIVQLGDNNKASTEQYGAGLGAQILQYGNGYSIGVTQSGMAGQNAPQIVIRQF